MKQTFHPLKALRGFLKCHKANQAVFENNPTFGSQSAAFCRKLAAA